VTTATLTDAQASYNRALRAWASARALSDASRPVSERDRQAVSAKCSEEKAEAKLLAMEEQYADRERRVENAWLTLCREASTCEVELGRPLNRHERETGFGSYAQGAPGEHRWWLTDGSLPCEVCVPHLVGKDLRALAGLRPPGATPASSEPAALEARAALRELRRSYAQASAELLRIEKAGKVDSEEATGIRTAMASLKEQAEQIKRKGGC